MKRTICLILTVLMLVGLLSAAPLSASAEESVTTVSTWSALKAALEDNKDRTIMLSKSGLTANISSGDRVIMTSGKKVLDLNDALPLSVTANGDVAFCNLITLNGGSLTVRGCSQINYRYIISSDYASTEKPSALCYVNGGTLKTMNCELYGISGSAVKIKSGTADIGIGSNLISQASWAVTDDTGAGGTLNIHSKAYLSSYNQQAYHTQGSFDGVGALCVRSANTSLSVSSGLFGGGVQFYNAAHTGQFSPKSKQISCNGSALLNYELRTDRSAAISAGENYYWYHFNGMYYFSPVDSSGGEAPEYIYVNYNKDQNYNIEVYDCDSAAVYGGYGKSFRGILTADSGDEVIIRSYTSKNFDKWVVLNGNPKIEDVTKYVTYLTMGSGDTLVMPTFKDTSIKSVAVTGVVAPKTGSTPNTFAKVPADADYEFADSQNNAVQWWHQNTMISYPQKYEAGTGYEARAVLVCKDGDQEFSNSVTATINGKSAEVIRNDGSSIVISYTFPNTDGVVPTEPDVSDFSYTINGSNATITKYNGTSSYVDVPGSINGCKVTEIGAAFTDNSTLLSVNIPSSVTTIGNSAFYNCSSLRHVTVPEGLNRIGSNAFAKCTALEEIVLPYSLDSIATYAFDGCSSLVDVILHEGLRTIGVAAFGNCPSLTNIDVPESVTSIGLYSLGFHEVGSNYEKNSSFSVTGVSGSQAETYADENGFNFISRESAPEWSDWEIYYPATPDESGREYRYKYSDPSVTEFRVISEIANVKLSATKYTYSGKSKIPKVNAVTDKKGKKLTSGKDYTVSYPKKAVNAGKYTVTVTFKGRYTGRYNCGYTIAKAANPIKISKSAKSVKYAAVKKKNTVVTSLTVTKAQGTKAFKKLSGNKKITVSTTTGKLTLKKGLKKGTYKVKIKVTAKGTKNYNSYSKNITVSVKVK